MTPTRRNASMVALAALLMTAGLLASCSKATSAINDAAVRTAAGSWTCLGTRSDRDGGIKLHVDDDGKFDLAPVKGDEPGSKGTWKVVDDDVELKVDKTVARILDAKGLAADMGSVTVEVPVEKRSGTVVERVVLGIRAEGTKTVVVTPQGKGASLFPSAPWTCRKA